MKEKILDHIRIPASLGHIVHTLFFCRSSVKLSKRNNSHATKMYKTNENLPTKLLTLCRFRSWWLRHFFLSSNEPKTKAKRIADENFDTFLFLSKSKQSAVCLFSFLSYSHFTVITRRSTISAVWPLVSSISMVFFSRFTDFNLAHTFQLIRLPAKAISSMLLSSFSTFIVTEKNQTTRK